MHNSSPIYRRILLKLSGEALMGQQNFGIAPDILENLAAQIGELKATGVELGIVIGAGNFLRGASIASFSTRQVAADHMGMLATVMNSIALNEALLAQNTDSTIMSAVTIPGMAQGFSYTEAIEKLTNGQVVIFAGGTGNPFFTTDTAACLRGIEIGADVVFKATKVDGVYDKDPAKFADARFYSKLDYASILAQNLAVMDMTAIILCQQYSMPLRVFNMLSANNLSQAALSEEIGTLITG